MGSSDWRTGRAVALDRRGVSFIALFRMKIAGNRPAVSLSPGESVSANRCIIQNGHPGQHAGCGSRDAGEKRYNHYEPRDKGEKG